MRESVGAALLLISIFFAWSDMHEDGWPLAVLATLAVLGTLVLRHLGKLTGSRTALPPGAFIAPAVPMFGLISYTAIRELTGYDAVGVGLTLAGCGSLLVLQAATSSLPSRSALWMRVGCGLLGATALWGLITAIKLLHNLGSFVGAGSAFAIILGLTYAVGLPTWFLLRTMQRRSADWAAGTILAILLIVLVMSLGSLAVGCGIAGMTMGLTALTDDSIREHMVPRLAGANAWLMPSAGLITLSSLTFLYVAAVALLSLTESYTRTGRAGAILVVALGMAILGFASRAHADRGSPNARLLMVIWSAVVFVLTCVNLADSVSLQLGGPLKLIYLAPVLPVLIAASATLPPAVQALGPLVPGATSAASAGSGPLAPGHPGPGHPGPGHPGSTQPASGSPGPGYPGAGSPGPGYPGASSGGAGGAPGPG